MKILLIGNLCEDAQESMQRFTTMLHTGLVERDHAASVLSPTLRLATLGPPYRYNGLPKYLGYFDKYVLFPRTLRRHLAATRPDVVHFTDHANAVYGPSLLGVPALATCHDLLQVRAGLGEIPQQRLSRSAALHQTWIRRSLARVPHITCVSAETRADLHRLTPLSPAQTSVTPNALNHPFHPVPPADARAELAALAIASGLDPALFETARGGFLLHVGGAHWYKNREGLLAIYAALTRTLSPIPLLVLVGPPLSPDLLALAEKLGVRSRLVRLGGVSSTQLEALYSLAEGLIFPSWEEGFGWPVAEAQACGCPVFTSNRAPMNDVGGRSSFYFDPADPAAAAAVITAAWPERNSRRAIALRESLRWQLGPMLDAYESHYHQLAR